MRGRKMDYIKKADRILGELIKEGKRDFIIFPFGERGMELKQILNQKYGIFEKYIVDNRVYSISENQKIINIEELQKLDTTNTIILLANDREETFNELRYQLTKVVDKALIVDVYSYSMYYDKKVYSEPNYFKDIRLATLESASREIYHNHVDGAIAECGVYRGEFSKIMARLMPDRRLYLFDTFSGFDERDNTGIDDEYLFSPYAKDFNFKDTSVELVLDNIGYQVDVVVRKGYFPNTAEGLEKEKFAVVSLDTDLYEPILSGLKFFWPRLNAGGFIFVHDFGGIKGVRNAVIDFCEKEHIGYTPLPDICHSAVLAKPL